MSLPGRLIDTSHGRLFVHGSGDGPPLVLVHGYLVSHYYFKLVIPELAKRFRVIAVDLPAHGESDTPAPSAFAYDLPSLADAVAEAVRALGVEKFALWGHSMGGGVSLTLAARHPERVERLLLEDATVYAPPMPLTGRISLAPLVGRFLYLNASSRRDFKNHFGRVFKDKSLNSDEMVDYYWERFNRPGRRVAAYELLRMLSRLADNTGDPGRVQAPALLVWGDEDRLIPLAHGKRLQKQVPGARMEVIGACGHSPHEERPDEILRLAVPFLAGEEAPAERGAEAGRG